VRLVEENGVAGAVGVILFGYALFYAAKTGRIIFIPRVEITRASSPVAFWCFCAFNAALLAVCAAYVISWILALN